MTGSLLMLDAHLVERGMLSADNVARRAGSGFAHTALVSGNDAEELRRLVALRPGSILAVGGGSVIDLAKLVGWAAGDTGRAETLLNATEPYVLLGRAPDAAPVRAAATTFGTGSEANGKASMRTSPRRLTMFASPSLTPSRGVLLGGFLDHLPPRMVAAGLGEILFRALGPALETRSGPRDRLIVSRTREILDVIDDFDTGGLVSSGAQGQVLKRLARIGRELHRPGFFDIESPYVGIPWFLGRTAQEMFPEWGLGKVDAIYDSWVRLAAAEQLRESSDYVGRWRELATGLMPAGRARELPLVHFLFTVMRRLFIDTDIWRRYGNRALEIPATFYDRWGDLVAWRSDGFEQLEHVYGMPLDHFLLGEEVNTMENENVQAAAETQDVELDAQELEEMDAPDYDGAISAAVSAAAVTVGIAIT